MVNQRNEMRRLKKNQMDEQWNTNSRYFHSLANWRTENEIEGVEGGNGTRIPWRIQRDFPKKG